MFVNQSAESVEVNRIKQLITKVGDDGNDTLKKDITKIVEVVADYYGQNKQEIRDGIIQAFIQTIQHLPLKAGIYATMLGLLSVKPNTQALSDLIIQGVIDQLPLISSEPTPILGQTLMKFLGELMNVGLLNTVGFVECLYDLEGGAENETSPFYLQILLVTLPYTMVKALEKNQIEFKNIIQNIEVLMSKRKSKDRLHYLWQAIRNYLNGNNQEKDNLQFMKSSYPRPSYLFLEELAQVKQIRKGFKVPIVKRTSTWIPETITVASDKVDSKLELQHELTRQWIYETVELFKTNRIQLVFQLRLYMKMQKLSPSQELAYQSLLVNTLLNMMIDTTPRQTHSSVFYSGLITHLQQSEKNKEWFEYVDSFVDQAPLNNLLVQEKLSDFLSHWIANSNFKINWEKLISRITDDKTEAGFINNYFATTTCRKLFQIVSIDKIKDLVPKELGDWFCNLSDTTKPLAVTETEMSTTINTWLQKKISAAELYDQMDELMGNAEAKVSCFLECLMLQISKSITHLSVLSRRYLAFLLSPKIVSSDILAELLLNTIYKLWNHSPLHLKIYLKEFQAIEVINNVQIVAWISQFVSPKQRYQDYEETFKQMNLLIAVNDVIYKQLFLEPQADTTYENTKQILSKLQQFLSLCNESLMVILLDNLISQSVVLLKKANPTQAERLLKEINIQGLGTVVNSF